MTAKQEFGFKMWTTLLSIFVAVMLYPNIVGKHGVVKSLFITILAVGAIWLMYFVIGRLINGAVAKELKRRTAERESGNPEDRE